MASQDEGWDCVSDEGEGEIDELEAAENQGAVNGNADEAAAATQNDGNPATGATADHPDPGDDPNVDVEDDRGADVNDRGVDGAPARKRQKKTDPLNDWNPATHLDGAQNRRCEQMCVPRVVCARVLQR